MQTVIATPHSSLRLVVVLVVLLLLIVEEVELSRDLVYHLLLALPKVGVEVGVVLGGAAVLRRDGLCLRALGRVVVGGLHLLYLLHGERGESFALGLVSLHADKRLARHFLRAVGSVVATITDEKFRVGSVRQYQQFALGIVAHETLRPLRGVHRESFQIEVALVVGIADDGRPDLRLVPLLQAQDVGLVVVGGVEGRDVEVARVEDHEDAVLVAKLAEVASVLLVVDALHVGVEPHLASAERGVAVAFQRDAVDGVAGEEVALCAASLDTSKD